MCCHPVCCDFFLVLLAIIFPPLPVWIKTGLCSSDSFINILLCILGFIPGLIHSWYIIAKYPIDVVYEYDEDVERQGLRHHFHHNHDGHGRHHHHHDGHGPHHHFTAVYVTSPSPTPSPQPSFPAQQQEQQSYGAMDSSAPQGPPPTYADASKNSGVPNGN